MCWEPLGPFQRLISNLQRRHSHDLQGSYLMKRRPVPPRSCLGRSVNTAVFLGLAALATSFAGGCGAEESREQVEGLGPDGGRPDR